LSRLPLLKVYIRPCFNIYDLKIKLSFEISTENTECIIKKEILYDNILVFYINLIFNVCIMNKVYTILLILKLEATNSLGTSAIDFQDIQ
jgi:hypothetical protein